VSIAWLRLTTTTGHHPKGDATRAACSVARASSVRWMVEARCITTKRRVAGVDRHCATRPGAVLIVEGLWVPGTRAGLRGLPGGAEGIRTDGHRGRWKISSYSSLRESMRGPAGGPRIRAAPGRG
jgi:hypothetical protein